MKYLNVIGKWEEMINEVVCGDCLEGTKLLADECVDLLLTDPPYGMAYQSSMRIDRFDKIELDTDIEWFPGFAREAFRVLKWNSHAYIFCNDYAISHFREVLTKVGFTVKRTLVWVKNNHTSGDLEGDYANKTEFILFAHKGRRKLFGKRECNVLEFDRVSNLLHPTEKPVILNQWLLEKSTDRGGLVLDPFMGSWTTARACKDLGRNFIGFELSEEYCKIGIKRLAQEVMF